MVDTVGFIYWIANFLLVSAVKIIIQTFSVVARLITLAVVEDTPAARVGTTSPGVRRKRTITAVPATSECVTFLVTNTIIGFAVTVC